VFVEDPALAERKSTMRQTRQKTSPFVFVGLVLLLGLTALAGQGFGAEPPPPFVVTDGGNVLDTSTGLVWGREIWWFGPFYGAQTLITDWAEENPEQADNVLGYSEENPTGWRPATIGEVLTIINSGFVAVVDLSFDEGIQGVDTLLPAGDSRFDPLADPPVLTFGDLYYWTACTGKIKGHPARYMIRFCDGDNVVSTGAAMIIPVRGAPPDHTLCPHSGEAGRPKKKK
jgi:hypothetical protein